MKYLLYQILFLFALSLSQTIYAQKLLSADDLKTNQLKSAILYWDFGSPEYMTLETIYTSKDSLNSFWNVTHRSLHPSEDDNGVDYYRVNANNLQPIFSQMFHPNQINYRIEYLNNQATIDIKNLNDTAQYQLKLPSFIAPEGPGTPLFLGSLPLKKDYQTQYYELNRWSGKALKLGQVELTKLKVIGSEALKIENKDYETLVVEITTANGRYTKAWVLKEAPHYWIKVHHKIDEKRIMKSQVVKILFLS